jgi:amidase
MAALVDFFARLTGRRVDRSTLEATTLACYEHGKTLSAEQLLEAFAVGNQICRAVGAFFEDYDVLITPTIASPALPLGTLDANDESLDAIGWSKKLFDFTPFTPLFNLTGQPAISLPLHMSKFGLPLGTQFVGRFGDEATLLRLARNLELAHPWPRIAPLITGLLDRQQEPK